MRVLSTPFVSQAQVLLHDQDLVQQLQKIVNQLVVITEGFTKDRETIMSDLNLTPTGKDTKLAALRQAALAAIEKITGNEARIAQIERVHLQAIEPVLKPEQAILQHLRHREIRDILRSLGDNLEPLKMRVLLEDADSRNDDDFIQAVAGSPIAFPMTEDDYMQELLQRRRIKSMPSDVADEYSDLISMRRWIEGLKQIAEQLTGQPKRR